MPVCPPGAQPCGVIKASGMPFCPPGAQPCGVIKASGMPFCPPGGPQQIDLESALLLPQGCKVNTSVLQVELCVCACVCV